MGIRWSATFTVAAVAAFVVLAPAASAAGKSSSANYPQASTPATVKITDDVGTLIVRRGGPAQLVVVKHWMFQEPAVTVQRNGSALTASATCPPNAPLNSCSVDFTLTLPDPFSLDATVNVGDIQVTAVEGTQKLRADVGDVAVAAARGDSLSVDAGSGDVVLRDLGVNRIDAASDNGDVEVDSVAVPASVTATGGNGDVDVAVPAGRYAVSVDVGNGDRSIEGVTVDPASPNKITASTDNGDVTIHAHGTPPGLAGAPPRPAIRRPVPGGTTDSSALLPYTPPGGDGVASTIPFGELRQREAASRGSGSSTSVNGVALFALVAVISAAGYFVASRARLFARRR